MFHVTRIGNRRVSADEFNRDARPTFFQFVEGAPGFIQPIKMS